MTAPSRRSDLVRDKRKQRKRSTSRRKTNQRAAPPMVSRSGRVYTPRQQARTPERGRTARKRYDVALNTSGAELRLPSVPVVRFGWRLVSGSLVVLLIWAIFAMWNAPQFTVNTVTVEGLERVNQAELINRLGVLDQSIFTVEPALLRDEIAARFSALNDVTVSVSYPAGVLVTAVERQPVIAWVQTGYANWWIDLDGMAFEPLGSSENLVHVEALAPPPAPTNDFGQADTLQSGPNQAAAQQLLSPAMVQGILFLDQVGPAGIELIYDQEHGLGWIDPQYKWQVFFGSELDNMDERLAVYRAMFDALSQKTRKPWLISLEFLHAPYYRLTR